MIPRTIVKLQQARTPDADIETLVWKNPIAFFAQSGRLKEADLAWPATADLRETFEGNSVLRGQDPSKI